MSELLGADRANNLSILSDVLHVLVFAAAVYLFYVLVKLEFMLERARAMLADPRFLNGRFLLFFHITLRYIKYLLLGLLILLLVFCMF